jgi:hypothetical protein
MTNILDYPLAVLAVSLMAQGLAAYVGDFLRKRGKPLEGAERADFGTVLPAALTLLGLIIGFSFSMAVTRYDQRKNYEEAEANAIGTEYLRADLLPATEAAHVRELLANTSSSACCFIGYVIRASSSRSMQRQQLCKANFGPLSRYPRQPGQRLWSRWPCQA